MLKTIWKPEASVADEQDRSEDLDDDKGPFPAEAAPVVDVIDQTADADPTTAEVGRSAIDENETGNEIDGIEAEAERVDDPFHTEDPAPEVAAMHITKASQT
ncbi:MAG: hypothetical protein HYX32_05895 [Actinobacteria bacterium]|nr:hypothetical protein [Actinomycetota bacterium]